jgi:ribonucleoside-diphosphate reductase alpha chain
MANAPTASTANIAGCYPTIEPIYKNLYVKSNMAGDFMVVNEFLVEDLKKLGLWSSDMLEKIKFYDGSVQQIEEIPPALRAKYKEVFEIEPQWLVKAAAYRGRWIDQSQSLNIFYSGTSGKVLSEIYQYAWNMGLKTTYYLRSMGASRIEKSTINLAKYGDKNSVGAQAQGASTESPTPSSIVIQETIVASVNASVPSPAMFTEQLSYAMKTTTPSTASETYTEVTIEQKMPEVVLAEPKQFAFGSSVAPEASATDTLITKRPQIEIMGEPCESCSA